MGKEERSKAPEFKKPHPVRKSSRQQAKKEQEDAEKELEELRKQRQQLRQTGIDSCASDIMKELNETIRLMNPFDAPIEQYKKLYKALDLDNKLTLATLPRVIDNIVELNNVAKLLPQVYNTSFTGYVFLVGTLLQQVHELLLDDDTRRIISENCQKEVLRRVHQFLVDSLPLPKPKSRSRGSTRHKRAKRKNTRRNKTSH